MAKKRNKGGKTVNTATKAAAKNTVNPGNEPAKGIIPEAIPVPKVIPAIIPDETTQENDTNQVDFIKESFEKAKLEFEKLPLPERKDFLETFDGLITEQLTDFPEVAKYESDIRTWAKEQLIIVNAEIEKEQVLELMEEINFHLTEWDLKDTASKEKVINIFRNTVIPETSDPKFIESLNDFKTFLSSQETVINNEETLRLSQEAAEKMRKTLNLPISEMKMIDLVSVAAMTSIIKVMGVAITGESLADMAFNYATSFMHEKAKREI